MSIFGENHPDTAQSLHDVGIEYSNLGDHEKPLEYKLKALEIRMSVFGENHPDITNSYESIGWEYVNMGNYIEAKKYFQLFFNSPCNIYSSQETMECVCRTFAVCQRETGDRIAAIASAKKALEYSKEIYKDSSSSLGKTYHCLANCQKAAEFYEDAMVNYIKAKELYVKDNNLEGIRICEDMINELKQYI